MSRNTLYALGGGAASAVLYLATPIGGLFATLPLLLAGLASGTRAGAIACLVGFTAISALTNPLVGGLYAILYGVPALVVVRQTLMHQPSPTRAASWYPAGGIISGLSATGIGLLVVAAAAAWSSGDDLQAITTRGLNAIMTEMPQLDEAMRERVVNMLVSIFPGLACASMLLVTLANGILAQTILVRQKRNIRPAGSFADATLPEWMSWLLVIAAALSLVGSDEVRYMGHNLAVIAALPFFFVGLSVFHRLARLAQFSWLILTVFYVMLSVFSAAAILVVAIGVIDQWFGLKSRFGGLSNDQENR